MNSKRLRTVVASCAFVVLAFGLVAGVGLGTFSAFGWEGISLLCPLGAISTMIATRTVLPRALVSLALVVVAALLVGRAFCGWLCPVPLLDRIRRFFRSPDRQRELDEKRREELRSIAKKEILRASSCNGCSSACTGKGKVFDSRHYVLGGALLSAAVFGFPVFCLICPIGLGLASVLVIWRLFAAGDMTVAVILVPLMLVIELVFLRKWCSRFCPLSALMNLVSRFGKTFVPVIDEAKCIETVHGVACSKCAEACEAGINLRHLEHGELALADCTRCRACVENCPEGAVAMPFLPPKRAGVVSTSEREESARE